MSRPSGEPMVSRDSLLYLLADVPDDKRRKIAEKVAAQSRDQLAKLYRQNVWGGNRKSAWLIAVEFTRRGIPPAFRPSPYVDGQPRIPEEDIFLHDLQWLGARYPQHRPLNTKVSGLFGMRAFDWAAKKLLNRGLHQPWHYLKVLTLTDDQQTECIYLRGAPVRRRLEVIDGLSNEVLERLKIANRINPRARVQTEDWRKTVERRHHVWRCGSLAEWQPKRTAELYTALTGVPMKRPLAGKIIGEVHRDYPASRPKRMRARRRRAAPQTRRTARTKASFRSRKRTRGNQV